MKKITIITVIILAFVFTGKSQNNQKIGAGYYGNMLTYPGLVFEYETEQVFSEKASLPIRADLGFYYHKRFNTGVFANVNIGFRRYMKSGLFLEESIGFGVLTTFLSSDDVFEVDDTGNITEASRYAATDFMPAITLGAGYKMKSGNLIWIRPQAFWQYPFRNSSLYTFAVQAGFSYTLKSK